MSIFLDSSNVSEITRFLKMGIIFGVTTNPTILLKDGVTGGVNVLRDRIKEIASLISPLPLSVEVTTTAKEDVISQALTFMEWGDNINIKLTIHGPNGELENLEIIHELETIHDVRVNVTAMMSAQQCFLAALAGATYVSLFCGRVNNMGYQSVNEIEKLRKLLDTRNLPSKIIAASTREILNVVEWLNAGAHIVTVLPNLLEGMLVHPYTKETVKMFLEDAEKAKGLSK